MNQPIFEFEQAVAAAGLKPEGGIIADGRVHRCATLDKPSSKNGWYVLYPDDPASGAYGDWRTGATHKWTSKNGNAQTPAERRLFRKRLEEAQKAREQDERKRHELGKERARKILARCKPARADHPYLIKKAVIPIADIRALKSLLVLPVLDETGAVTSLQFISPDGTKRFLTGGRVQGGYFPIKGASGPLFICEGYATGATINEARGATVLCALNAGNLEAIARMARSKYPQRTIVLAADNDSKTPANPGLTKARQAALAINAKVVWPEFPEGSDGTDFNDLKLEVGVEAVKKALSH